MSVNLKMTCKHHPQYQGIKAPSVKGGCKACEAIYQQAAYARDLAARPYTPALEIELVH